MWTNNHQTAKTISIFLTVLVTIVAIPVEASSDNEHCERTYVYQTLNWNPPFAEARLKATLEKLAQAGQAGFKIAKSLPDGTGGEVLVLEKRIIQCADSN